MADESNPGDEKPSEAAGGEAQSTAPAMDVVNGEPPAPPAPRTHYKHGPNGVRTAVEKGERPVSKEERLTMLGRILDGLDELLAAKAIDKKERDRRRRAAKDGFNGSCLWQCAPCDIIYGKGCGCPKCGSMEPAMGAKWDYDPAKFRKLAARLASDLLAVEGQAKCGFDKRAEAILPTPEDHEDLFGGIGGESAGDDSPDDDPPPTGTDAPPTGTEEPAPTATERGEALGIRPVK